MDPEAKEGIRAQAARSTTGGTILKVLHTKTLKSGKRHVLVELTEGEKIKSFSEDGYYRLGGQLDDVVGGHVITEAEHVTWCSIEQEWIA